MLEKINQEIKHSPEGCLKIQQNKGKIYYYHQYKDNTTEKMTKRYILREEENLAKALAQKGYYVKVKPLLEKELQTNGAFVVIHPDFTILNIRTGKMFYWEHAGRMDDPRYSNDFVQKMNLYMENQLFQGEDVVVTYETMTNPLNVHNVNILVQKMIEKDEINDMGKSDVHM